MRYTAYDYKTLEVLGQSHSIQNARIKGYNYVNKNKNRKVSITMVRKADTVYGRSVAETNVGEIEYCTKYNIVLWLPYDKGIQKGVYKLGKDGSAKRLK